MRYALLLLLVFAAQAEDRLRLGLFTAMPVKWDLEHNWRVFEEAVERHAGRNIDVIVTPECFLDGYVASAKDWSQARFETIAQPPESSRYIERLRSLARKHRTWILFGFTEKAAAGIYNTAMLVDREGKTAGVYHKTHLQDHDLRFAAGSGIPVFETEWGKVGVLICADRRWPETSRTIRLRGGRLILIPSYGMWHIDNEWWMRTRSYENGAFLAFVHPNVAFVADPRGQILSKLQTNVPEMLVCDIDLSKTSDRDLRDRRPELYDVLTRPE